MPATINRLSSLAFAIILTLGLSACATGAWNTESATQKAAHCPCCEKMAHEGKNCPMPKKPGEKPHCCDKAAAK